VVLVREAQVLGLDAFCLTGAEAADALDDRHSKKRPRSDTTTYAPYLPVMRSPM
jgi:hypothetical protein